MAKAKKSTTTATIESAVVETVVEETPVAPAPEPEPVVAAPAPKAASTGEWAEKGFSSEREYKKYLRNFS